MRTLQIHIRASLPPRLQPLWELARNVWWSWNPDAIALFRRIDPEEYEASGPCPLKMLNRLPARIWDDLSKDASFLEHLDGVVQHFRAYMQTGITTVDAFKGVGTNTLIGYFSMEFGLHESIPLYSGGLGILAGDHLKTASDLSLPLVAIGLFYSEGYFRQSIGPEGWQRENYDHNDPFYLPMSLVEDKEGDPLMISVCIASKEVYCQVWQLNVGRIPLYLLDTDIPLNSPEMRRLTSRLYSGGQDLRIQQEMILGIGGVKALRAMGISPTVFHLNEGHSAFLTLERVAEKTSHGLHWREALFAVKGAQVFTVHTPVPAGNDAFPIEKLQKYLGNIQSLYSLPDEVFYNLGRAPDAPDTFSMPVFALRTSSIRNGVSQLHKKVSQRIWKHLWPSLSETEIPILGITNGAHTQTWLSPELMALFNRYLGKGWEKKVEDEKIWAKLEAVPDSEIWDIHLIRKSRLISSVLKAASISKTGHSVSTGELRQLLRPEILTLGFARRFATYKRGNLIFRDLERLKRLVLNDSQPVQIFIAGKAHPADHHGKEVIQNVCNAIERAKLNARVIFLENYDMNIARRLVRGVDVWVNTPIRPLEASGTSGMKAGFNGCLNFSILDGWWDEGYNGENGWVIGDREEELDERFRDQRDADSLYDLLEFEIIPTYYSSALPTEWIRLMKGAIMSVAPKFSAQRMLLDYVHRAYAPAQRFFATWGGTGDEQREKLREHLSHVDRLQSGWNDVRILHCDLKPHHTVSVGEKLKLQVEIAAPFPESWLDVSLLLTDSHKQDNFHEADLEIALSFSHRQETGVHVFACEIDTKRAGVHAYTLRVTPRQVVFPNHLDLNLVTRW